MSTGVPGRLEVVCELALASLLVRWSSDRRNLDRLGSPAGATGTGPARPRSADAAAVGRRVAAAAHRLPWRPACLPQAVAAQRLLHRRGLAQEVHVGVDPTGQLRAHAWVTSDGSPVLGGDGRGFTRVATLSLADDRARAGS